MRPDNTKQCTVSVSGEHEYFNEDGKLSINVGCLHCGLLKSTIESQEQALHHPNTSVSGVTGSPGYVSNQAEPTPKVRPTEGEKATEREMVLINKIDDYIKALKWNGADDYTKTLVIGNIRGMTGFIRSQIQDARQEERKFIGKNKREFYEKGYRDCQKQRDNQVGLLLEEIKKLREIKGS